MRTIAIVSALALMLFALYLIYKAIAQTVKERKAARDAKALYDGPLQKPYTLPHEHDWRKVTEFARQCKVCKRIEVTEDAPDGLADYMSLLTTEEGRKNTKLASQEYKNIDPKNRGINCPECKRIIPSPEELPMSPFVAREFRCPFCNYDLGMIPGHEQKAVVRPECSDSAPTTE